MMQIDNKNNVLPQDGKTHLLYARYLDKLHKDSRSRCVHLSMWLVGLGEHAGG